MIGCLWNNSRRILLLWRMFQFLRTTLVNFGSFGEQGSVKIGYMSILMECVLDLVVRNLYLVVDRLLKAYQLFLIAHQQVSDGNLASKISLSVLLIIKIFLGLADSSYSKCLAIWDAVF